MPWCRCPACRSWSRRWTWRPLGEWTSFRVVCPVCAVASEVAAVPLLLRPPAAAEEEMTAAALALRVWRTVTAAR
jgi:hypothetical protein